MKEIKTTASMMGDKTTYVSPLVESVSIRVELGFALTPDGNLEQPRDNDLESF